MDERLNGMELVQAWEDANKVYRYEGERGMEDLERLCETIGYGRTGFRFGNPIERFLADNPGACEAIRDFIAEWACSSDDWAEALRVEQTDEE